MQNDQKRIQNKQRCLLKLKCIFDLFTYRPPPGPCPTHLHWISPGPLSGPGFLWMGLADQMAASFPPGVFHWTESLPDIPPWQVRYGRFPVALRARSGKLRLEQEPGPIAQFSFSSLLFV